MRRLVIFLLCFCCGLTASAQAVASPPPTYKAEPFIGTWEWHSGSDMFRLTIRRDLAHRRPDGTQVHEMMGMHMYMQNGVVVENAFSDSQAVAHGGSFLGQPSSDTELLMFFVDISRHKTGKVLLTIDPANPDRMQLEIRPEESAGIAIPGQPAPPPGFTIPDSMTLTRIL